MADTTEIPIPPASFLFLLESILMQAQMHLGLFNLGEVEERGEKPEPNLALARHSIDLLGVLQEKTKGNLTVEEQRLLENGLTELRFRYVQVADEFKRKGEPPSGVKENEKSEKEDDRPLIITADGGKGSKTE
jgi:Domain of unknown function (DUF1844)